MTSRPEFTGLILAGGRASRMGRDKALLRLGGVTLLDQARDLLCHAGAAKTVILGRPDEADGLADNDPGAGPARAISSAIDGLSQDCMARFLVIPVDMPNLTPACLVDLMEAGISACYHAQPMPLFIRVKNLNEDARQARSVRDFASAIQALTIPAPPDARLFTNINTPDDFEHLSATYQAR